MLFKTLMVGLLLATAACFGCVGRMEAIRAVKTPTTGVQAMLPGLCMVTAVFAFAIAIGIITGRLKSE